MVNGGENQDDGQDCCHGDRRERDGVEEATRKRRQNVSNDLFEHRKLLTNIYMIITLQSTRSCEIILRTPTHRL